MTQKTAARVGVLTIIILVSVLAFLSSWETRRHNISIQFQRKIISEDLLKKRLRVVQSNAFSEKTISLSDILKKNSEGIVNFWATWCAPCIEEIPSLDSLAHATRGRKFPPIITISVDEYAKDILGLFETLPTRPSFTVLHDPDGEVSRGFGTTKFPETFWLASSGEVLQRWVGPQDWLSAEVIHQLRDLSQREAGT